jgi:glycosyltransferase involved in cell wall biosynthesis
MKIAFVSTQSASGSTLIGRTLPLAKHMAAQHDVHLLAFAPLPAAPYLTAHLAGRNPFVRTVDGKKRLRSWALLFNMLSSALTITWLLWRINPERIVIVKTLPHNVMGVRLWQLFHPHRPIIIDVDDFELTANKLSSLWQRASIHWAQRCASRMAGRIITATPFLSDYFSNLRPRAEVTTIPTGIHSSPPIIHPSTSPHIAFFGSLSVSSGHRVDYLPGILSALQKSFPQTKLIIAGSGDDEAWLKQEFASRGITSSVLWHGRFNDQDLISLLRNTAIIIDPVDSSIANRAKSSFRVALAISVGLPVITSNVGIRPWLIPPSLHSRFFAAPNHDSYALQVAALFSRPLSPSQRQGMVSYSARYHWSKLAADYHSIVIS